MRKLSLLFAFIVLFTIRSDAQDMIITQRNDTIRCALQLPPIKGDKLFYSVPEGGEVTTYFVPCSDVKFIYEGITDRYFYVDTKNAWVEIADKKFRPQPVFRNRIKVAAGVELSRGNGSAPVVELEYIRYQWKNFGIGVLADYIRHGDMVRKPVPRQYSSQSLFVGPEISGRFYGYNTNSFFYVNLALGYYAIASGMEKLSLSDKLNNFSFLATVGWEILLSRTTHWAIDMEFHLYPDGMGFTLGTKFGK